MFAAWLFMHGEANNNPSSLCSAMEYEPGWSRVNEYVFDFSLNFVHSTFMGPALFVELIEYKPAEATEAYLQEWGRRCHEVSKRISHITWLSFRLYTGNFWTGQSNLLHYLKTDSEGVSVFHDMGPWIDSATAERIRRIRFDLKGGA
jgi:hypothetical protein